jgi:hypothetical protein
MHKSLPLLALIVTASISVGRLALAESRFEVPLPRPLATDVARPDVTVVLVGGMGGGTGGGMGGMNGSGMPNNPVPSLGTNSSSGSPANSAQPSYYTYQCAIPGGGCSIVAPASLRSISFRPGARCSCSEGLSQGQIK